jgi:hypothetical protein
VTGAINRANARTDRKYGREEERACITGNSWRGETEIGSDYIRGLRR